MPLEIIRNDISKMTVDVIVNPSNESMYGSAGTDGIIHRLAGPLLKQATKELSPCKPGQVRLTDAFELPCHYIIHTVGPIWTDGKHGEEDVLKACYENALSLALEKGFDSIAFPLIASGTYGYPKDLALQTAIQVISSFLLKHDLLVYLVVYDPTTFQLSEKLFNGIESYIDDHYVEENILTDQVFNESARYLSESLPPLKSINSKRSLEDLMKELDLSFSEMLFKHIDERGLKDSEVYKKANIDRRLFSKIRNNKHYKTSKQTVLALSIALELSLDETVDLLKKAGFALSNSSKSDLIIKYFIEKEIYNIFEIDEALFAFGQDTIGSQM